MAKYNPVVNRSRLKAYKRVGIRRDQDLSDLSNTAKGLENLLNSLVDETGESFSINDLNSIKNVFARGLSNSNYQNIVGSSVKFTTPDGKTVEYDPRITYQNRINKFEIFTGNPRLGGGDGLTANYYQNDQINFNSHLTFKYTKPNGDPLDPNDSESDIFLSTTTEGKIPSDNFWELGDFEYTGKVHPQSVKANAGVMWEGYYIPRDTAIGRFRIRSTGYYTFDFAKEGYFEDNNKNQTSESRQDQIDAGIGAGNTYTSYARVGLTTTIAATGVVGNSIVIAANRVPTVGIGMSVSGANINSTNGAPIVSNINHTTGVITLNPVEGESNSVTGTLNNDVTFTRVFGSESTTIINTHVLLAFEKYRIRIRYFHPQIAVGDVQLNQEIKNINKRVIITHAPPFDENTDDLHHDYLYPIDYDFSESAKGTFNTYSDKSVLFGGTKLGIGIGERDDFNKYVKLKTTNKIDLKYKVKKNLAEITKTQRTGGLTETSKIVTMGITSSIEIGNYVFGNGIPDQTVVEEITTNRFIILSKEATVTGDESLKFIDHRGFVKKVNGTHATNADGVGVINSITPDLFDQASRNANTGFQTIDTDVQVGMVAIGANLNQYSVITSMPSTTEIVLDKNISSTGDADVYIYQSRGLKDNSLQNFCDRFSPTPEVRCLVSNHETTDANGNVSTYTLPGNAGITTIRVDDINSVGLNWELQGAYFGADGIKVSAIDPTEKILTLDSQITRPLPDGAQFTAVGTNDQIVSQNGDYQLCCPPTDTSPPFNAAEEGLETTLDHKNFQVVSGNLIFDSIIMKDTNSNAYNLSENDNLGVNRKIEIKTPLSTNTKKFKLLGTTSRN